VDWLFSDGTRVQLGGRVEGDGALARKLRSELELLPFGRARPVSVRPQPGGGEELDTHNPYHVHAWCTGWAYSLRTRGETITLKSAPALPPLPVDHDHDPHTVY
jgi:hypothetical protein